MTSVISHIRCNIDFERPGRVQRRDGVAVVMQDHEEPRGLTQGAPAAASPAAARMRSRAARPRTRR